MVGLGKEILALGEEKNKKKRESGFCLDGRERVRVVGGKKKRREIARKGESVPKRDGERRNRGMGERRVDGGRRDCSSRATDRLIIT